VSQVVLQLHHGLHDDLHSDLRNISAQPLEHSAMTSSTSALSAAVPPLREDASFIGLIGTAHLISHFSQLLLAPLFPWLKDAFNVSYAELGLLMSVFFVVSCASQAAAGFAVDRFGPRPILFVGLGILGTAALGFAFSSSYTMLLFFSAWAGIGNGVFHPVDFTLLNRKVHASRLGHAFSVHGITGSLGWALAPALLVPITLAYSWRTALMCAAALIFAVLALLLLHRDRLALPESSKPPSLGKQAIPVEGNFDFLKIPAVWMCFAFFFFNAMVLSAVQAFAPEAARLLHSVPVAAAAMCLTIYMVCSAGGMVVGGFLASNPARCERVIAVGYGFSAVVALTMASVDVPAALVPLMFGVMGFASGTAGPSRDLIVKSAAPANATGRVYGVVYSGLDIGQAVAPLLFGTLMDHGQPMQVWVGIAVLQVVLIASAFNVRRVRRTSWVGATA
jgi:MFS transporter, FSR family, fosmidomycin resistance protein